MKSEKECIQPFTPSIKEALLFEISIFISQLKHVFYREANVAVTVEESLEIHNNELGEVHFK